ncbi:MAG: DUF72 domain-containing protein [Chloroflexi bacterium]|nr:DUF72 domain-containing protein [Chloroflexota bacterium]
MPVRYHIGTSGWHYDHWIERFYPKGLPKKEWLGFYSRHFPTVELNRTFYRLPTEEAWESWRQGTPPEFIFAIKASRSITHFKKLRNVERSVGLIVGRATLLADKLGPILYQLPPNFHRNDQVLEAFLALLPADLQQAMEFRHSSWFAPEVWRLLEKHGVALCTFDLAGLTCPLVATAGFVYHRFHGYAGNEGYYPDREMEQWAAKLADLTRGKSDAFVYFNNDARAAAVDNARKLTKLLE